MADYDARNYWESRLTAATGLEGVGFARLGLSFNRWTYRLQAEVFRERVRDLGLDLARCDVLDVGSGVGFFVGIWHELGARTLTGVDVAAVAVQLLQARFPGHTFARVDVGRDEIPLADESIDVVSCVSVLFHLVDDADFDTALASIARVLRPGGTLIVTDTFVHAPVPQTRSHYVDRTLDAYERALGRHGLEPVERRPFFVLMNTPSDSNSKLRRAVWLAIAGGATLAEPIGNAIGAALFPIERQLVRRKRESASTEMMVCRKRDTSARNEAVHDSMRPHRTTARTSERHRPEDVDSSDTQAMDVRHRYAYAVAREFVQPTDRLLDLGCGVGYGFESVRGAVAEYVGVDVSADAIDDARRRYPVTGARFDLYDGTTLPYEDACFDVVSSFQVIEHVADVQAYLEEIRRVTRPGAHVLITTPNRILRLGPGERPWNRFHLREYDARDLRDTVGRILEDVEVLGVRGPERMELLEQSRVARARRIARIDRLGLRYALPQPLDSRIRRLLRRRGFADADSTFAVADMRRSATELERALDLLVVARSPR